VAVLIIDLRALNQGPVDVEGEIATDDPVFRDAGLEMASPLAVRAKAGGSPTRSVWVRGELAGRVRTSCRRCLEPLELDVSEEFEMLFDPKVSEADADLSLYAMDPKAEELDLSSPLKESFMLAIPAYPLCRDGCPGLCGRCGKTLNEGSCDCEPAESDPRWGPLQGLQSGT